jgi:glycosyltransferase 2 family protein
MRPLSKSLKIALITGKVLLALVIVGYLVTKIHGDAGFSRLYHEPKQWSFLAVALALVLTAFTFSFVRWYLLVRGLGLLFHLRDALRLGSLGFMLNQIMPGSVGGDLFKAAFIAHEQPGRRTEAVASVFIDRFVGLVAMLVVASVGLLLADPALQASPLLTSIEVFVWSVATVGIAGLLLLTNRLISGIKTQQLVRQIPMAGHPLSQLAAGLHRFGSHRRYLLAAFGLALATHGLLVSAFWCVGRGLPIVGPTFPQNTTIVPLALVAGAMPLTPGGLGLMESGLAQLFVAIDLQESDGAMVALAYRALTYVVAAIGACYYLSAKRRMDRLLEEAETLAEEIA